MTEVFETRLDFLDNLFSCTENKVTTFCEASWQSEAQLTDALRYVTETENAIHPAGWPDLIDSDAALTYFLLAEAV